MILACGGGGGGGDGLQSISGGPPPVSNNLSAADLVVETADPTIGYPMKVSVTLAADKATDNVSVSLFAIDKSDDPSKEVRQIPLGSQSLAQMDAGARPYTFDVNIPSSVEFPGPYFIAAIIDPAEEITETDEEDNTATIETILLEGQPNILLTELALDRTALLINTDTYQKQVPGTAGNVHNADAGGTITVGANGLKVYETIDIEAFAKLRLMRSDTGTSHDVPLYLWNSDAGRYINAYGIDPETGAYLGEAEWLPLGQFMPQLVEQAGEEVTLNDVNRDSAHLNFYFPGRLGSELEQAMRYANQPTVNVGRLPTVPPPDLTPQSIADLQAFLYNLPSNGVLGDESEAMAVMDFAVCVEIRPVDPSIVEFLADDNERCSPIAIALPPIDSKPPTPDLGGFKPHFPNPAYPLTSGDGFGTDGGGSAFNYLLDFGASATADNRGYIEEIHGIVPVTTFGVLFPFFNVTVRAQMVPDYAGKPAGEESGYTVELRFLKQLLHAVDLPPGSPPAVSISFSKEAPAPDEKKVPKQYFVGPVPVDAGGSVAGNIGVEYAFLFTDPPAYRFGNQVKPFANVEASLYAGVGTSLFSVGVEGVLTLLDESITLYSGTDIEILDLGYVSGIAEFLITQGKEVGNAFTGPIGKLNLYAKYSVPKIVTCDWGFIKGKCIKSTTIKATHNIWSSPALFELNDIIYTDTDVALDVVVMNGQSPQYFVP